MATALNDEMQSITEAFSGATPIYGVNGITGWNQPGLSAASGILNPAGGSSGTNSLNPASGVGSYFNGAASGLGGSYGGVPSTGSTGTSGGSVPFSLNPTPTQGSGTTFGMVPGAIGAPPSVWQQEQQIPGVSAATTAETGNINSELAGQLSPGTTENLEDSAAARGLSLGQGGNTGLVDETLLKTLGLTQEELQQAGSTNLNSFLSTSGQQQQSPQLMAEIASSNATNAAAPNPTLWNEEQIALHQGSGGGGGGGYGPTSSGTDIYGNSIGGGTSSGASSSLPQGALGIGNGNYFLNHVYYDKNGNVMYDANADQGYGNYNSNSASGTPQYYYNPVTDTDDEDASNYYGS
jgi:hypothetical protein